jgi:outer membrane biosynthesis protein TonB
MDRAETTGLGVALAAHGALFAALSLGLGAVTLPRITGDPIEVSFADETGLLSSAPVISQEAPAPSLAPELGAPEEAAPASAPAVAPPLPDRPSPAPAQKASRPAAAEPQPRQKSSAAGTRTATRGSRFGEDFMKGLNDDPSASRSQSARAATVSAEASASLRAEVRRQLKPHWKAPTGADAEKLRTELSISLARDGSVTDIEILRTTGQTDSNRPQVRLHQEQAVRAVRLASPFNLPAEFYDAWKQLSPIGFDKRLSQ